jgi:hypothetical protein
MKASAWPNGRGRSSTISAAISAPMPIQKTM